MGIHTDPALKDAANLTLCNIRYARRRGKHGNAMPDLFFAPRRRVASEPTSIPLKSPMVPSGSLWYFIQYHSIGYHS